MSRNMEVARVRAVLPHRLEDTGQTVLPGGECWVVRDFEGIGGGDYHEKHLAFFSSSDGADDWLRSEGHSPSSVPHKG